ncbi:hypothetical protein LAZ40_04505 [Cereibacter sphaeroides]|uniref:hypothetical protein n=1 Tax=Cereibacter sphaeroides TaxID=1063 RepID=UPI001F20A26B|nr:hypothetical protein [Cereibacter sphaeroides]MCE6958317.1 hypothetical protein [Cereibacter sphaeroides]MCE6971927.1 hypothetical protein [Cereibacter sphaeroides]
MFLRPFAALLAAAIALSFFLPWIYLPFGGPLVPSELMRNVTDDMVREMPPVIVLFLFSFVLAGGLALSSLWGWCPKVAVFLTGALPLGLVTYAVLGGLRGLGLDPEMIRRSNIPAPSGEELHQIYLLLKEILGMGLVLYVGGALLLVLVALVVPGKPAAAAPGLPPQA